MSWEDEFAELGDYYPGSSKRIPRGDPPKPPEPEKSWDASPRIYAMDGVDYEFFSIGDLATALNRRPVTIRYWESAGYIPVTDLRSPSTYPSKRHRIYSRAQIEGIILIARHERILDEARPRIGETQFQQKVLDLFVELAKLPLYGARRLDDE